MIDRRLRDLRDWILERLGKRCSRYEKEEKKEKNIHSSTIAKSILFRKKETRASQFLLHLFSASPWYPCSPPRQLTNFFRLIILNDLGQLHVPSDHRHLVGSLVRVIQAVLLRASEQQLAYAGRVRVVHSANVQRRVAGRVTRVHVGTVKKQVIQVLDQVVAAGLRTCGGEERGSLRYRLSKDTRMCDYNYKTVPLCLSLCPSNLPLPLFFRTRRGGEGRRASLSSYRKKKEGRGSERGGREKSEKVKSET